MQVGHFCTVLFTVVTKSSPYSFAGHVTVVKTYNFHYVGVKDLARLVRRPYEVGAKIIILNSHTHTQ